ncbi:MAG: dienelactone hydrolase family protein [Phenylobacterium sp.]
MCDDEIHVGRIDGGFTRRAFGITAAAAAGALPAWAQAEVVEKVVEVKTPDGVADGFLIRPAARGTYPAVLFWPDGGGLRGVIVDMAKRLAAAGYVVLTPNPFYRTGRAPVFPSPIDFSQPEFRARFMAARGLITEAGLDSDILAYLAFLDAQPQTDRRRKAGVQGYCMSGAMAFRAAALLPDRIAAVASFHGGGLVTKEPSSPHLLIPKTRARFLVGIAQNDDKQQPEAKDVLRAAFSAAGRPAMVEVYPADHGWCVPGSQVYNEQAAEKAWAELTRLYKEALV